MASEVESFTIDSMIRGYHVYKDVWSSFIGEVLYCRRDIRNHHDPFAVAMCKGTTVVGHVPRKISAVCYVFLGKTGATITGTVTGSRRFSHDLPQGGMEIPCVMKFTGDKVMVNTAKSLLVDTRRPLTVSMPVRVCSGTGTSNVTSNCSKLGELEQPVGAELIVEANDETVPDKQVEAMTQETVRVHEGITDPKTSKKVLECNPPCKDGLLDATSEENSASKQSQKYDAKVCLSMVLLDPVETTSGSKDIVKHQGNTSSSSTWVKFGRVSLTFSDRDEIAGGFQLNDKHINYAQSILKCQFSIQGLQSTLLQATSKPRANELQIVHSRGNHWITASTILSKPNAVNVHDSLYDFVDEESLKIIQQLFGVKEVHVVPVQKQQGFSDCGLFAIAYAVHLAKKRNPEKAYFYQSQMRSHFINCLSQGKMSSFPSHQVKPQK